MMGDGEVEGGTSRAHQSVPPSLRQVRIVQSRLARLRPIARHGLHTKVPTAVLTRTSTRPRAIRHHRRSVQSRDASSVSPRPSSPSLTGPSRVPTLLILNVHPEISRLQNSLGYLRISNVELIQYLQDEGEDVDLRSSVTENDLTMYVRPSSPHTSSLC